MIKFEACVTCSVKSWLKTIKKQHSSSVKQQTLMLKHLKSVLS